MEFFSCFRKKKVKQEHRFEELAEEPTPTPAPAPFNIKPKKTGPVSNIYPGNWKYTADPDGGLRPLKTELPAGVVIHHTVTYNLNSTVSYFKRNDVDVHFVIGHDGKVVQMVDCNKAAAHAGKSEWDGMEGLNDYFVGIELVNLGPLTKNSQGGYVDAYNRAFSGPVRERKAFGHKYWEACTKEQEQALVDLCRWLMDRYAIPKKNIIAHFEASPGRKIDPAGALSFASMDDFRKNL